MTDRTAEHIKNMKQQNFMLEIGMNNITRQNAAKTSADFFRTGRSEFNGVDTWSAWDSQGREWKFRPNSGIRGSEDKKCELVTEILNYEDIPELLELLRTLRHAGAKSSLSRGCEINIYVGMKSKTVDHTAKTLINLANIMRAHETQILKATKITESRTVNPIFVVRLNNSSSLDTMDRLFSIWEEENDINYGSNIMLDYGECLTKGMIGFRRFRFDEPHDDREGGIHRGQLKSYIQFCLAMSQLAKELQFANPTPQKHKNENHAFRCWMLRLGFVGEEFKTVRTLLLRNMEEN